MKDTEHVWGAPPVNNQTELLRDRLSNTGNTSTMRHERFPLESFSDTYVIMEVLGSGSGGVVYRAYHKRLEVDVVVKKMKNKSMSMRTNRREVDILKNLQHSFLPRVLDFLEDNDEVYTVMSYVPGKSLQQMLEEGYHFSLEDLVRIGMQLSSALNYLHRHRPPIIHSDIKPANIMLTPGGDICLIDFNISFFLDGNTVLGYSHGYTSPEQYDYAMHTMSRVGSPYHSVIDTKTDIYSVGATLYHLATRTKRIDYQAPIDRERLLEYTSESFVRVIETAMQNDARKRFPDALAMFNAFKNVPGKDRDYHRLLRTQRWVRAALVGGLALMIVTAGIGMQMMGAERIQHYNRLVERQRNYRQDGFFEDSEAVFREAVRVLPTALEGYYQQALSLHQQGLYGPAIDFIEQDILRNHRLDILQVRLRDIYYLLADSFFQVGDYENAVRTYRRLFRLGENHDLEHYRGYAIALVHNGEHGWARDVLDEAIALGIGDDFVYYVQGEISLSLGLLEEAQEYFLRSIEVSRDRSLIARAYVMSSEIYESLGDLAAAHALLQEAIGVLPTTNQLFVLNRLIHLTILLAQDTGDTDYLRETITHLNQMIEMGWGTYDTYNNLVIIHKQLGEWEQAADHLDEMIHRFGEDYNIFKRLAFLEIERQELLPIEDRDYFQFIEYFYQAQSMYEVQREGTDTNPEMMILENIYQQVIGGGW